jgi:hypothetical protein
MQDGAEVGGGANEEVCLDSLLTLMTRLKTRYERVSKMTITYSNPRMNADVTGTSPQMPAHIPSIKERLTNAIELCIAVRGLLDSQTKEQSYVTETSPDLPKDFMSKDMHEQVIELVKLAFIDGIMSDRVKPLPTEDYETMWLASNAAKRLADFCDPYRNC